jgi:SAM-dependent methyltransferase
MHTAPAPSRYRSADAVDGSDHPRSDGGPAVSSSATAPELVEVACAVCGATASHPARIRVPIDDHAGVLDLPGGRSHWVVCDTCALVYQSPRPGPDAVARLYDGGDYHTTRGGVPEHYVQYSLRRSVDALDWALARIPGPGRALDIGCGIGGALVKLQGEGWDVIGVEPDGDMADVARERFGLTVTTGMFEDDTFPDEHVDLAYSCHVWEHLADPVATSRAAHALLAERSGHLMIVVPTFRKATTLAWSCFTAPHTYMFTDVSLGNVLDQAGFDVVDHAYVGAADSELWLLAKARPEAGPRRAAPVVEDPAKVQRELALVPLRLPLGIAGRVRTHVQTLASDPKDFTSRLGRWVGRRAERLKRTVTRS